MFCSGQPHVQGRRRWESEQVISGFPLASPVWAAGLFALLTLGPHTAHSAPHHARHRAAAVAAAWPGAHFPSPGLLLESLSAWRVCLSPLTSLVPATVSPCSSPQCQQSSGGASWQGSRGWERRRGLQDWVQWGLVGLRLWGGHHGGDMGRGQLGGGCSGMLERAGPHGRSTCWVLRAGLGWAPLLLQPPLLESCWETGEAGLGSWAGEEPPASKVAFQFLL